MNTLDTRIIYRGFTPINFEINNTYKKPDVIYRGFKAIDVRTNVETSLQNLDIIYRGVRSTKMKKLFKPKPSVHSKRYLSPTTKYAWL